MKAHLLGPMAAIQGHLKKLMKHFLYRLDHLLKSFLARLRTLMKRRGTAIVLPYMGFAANGQIRILGRVMEQGRHPEFVEGAGRLKHLFRVIRLFVTYDLSHAKIQARYQGQAFEFESDAFGFFNRVFDLRPSQETKDASIEFSVVDSSDPNVKVTKERFVGEVFHVDSDYIVVSDIDDTILRSHATNIYRLVFKTLFLPFEKRQTFLNTVHFYEKLHGTTKKNLFFYVSSSSWNIYPLLKAFIENAGFPKGPMLLQNLGQEKLNKGSSDHEHKLHRIREIADLIAPTPLILIGDAGQRDPYLYLQALREYQGRIAAIYIRKLPWLELFSDHEELILESRKLGCEIKFFEDPAELF